MRRNVAAGVGVLMLLAALPTLAQKVKLEPDQRYLLLATTKTATMQEELDEVAAKGFRIVVGSPTSGKEMVLLMERVATPPDVYRYMLLATDKTSTMQKELDLATAEGFRLLPRTMIAKEKAIKVPFSSDEEVVVLLERLPKPDKQYKYLLLATSRTGTLQKEIAEALAQGFVLAGMVSRGEHMVIMEKESEQ